MYMRLIALILFITFGGAIAVDQLWDMDWLSIILVLAGASAALFVVFNWEKLFLDIKTPPLTAEQKAEIMEMLVKKDLEIPSKS